MVLFADCGIPAGIVMAGDRKQGHTISRTEGARMAEQPGLDCQTIQRARDDLDSDEFV